MKLNKQAGNMQAGNRQQARIKVGIDVDGTLAFSQRAIINEYNMKTASGHAIEELDSYIGWSHPITEIEFSDLHFTLWKDNWKRIRPTVSEGQLLRLMEICDAELSTGIPSACDSGLKGWLNANFPNASMEIRYVMHMKEKMHMGYGVIFDDSTPVADEFLNLNAAKEGTRLYLIDQPWNRKRRYEEENSGIIRVESIGKGIDHLLSTLRK